MRPLMRTEDVIREVDAGWGAPCTGCTQALVGQEVVLSLLMGFRTTPHCADCLAQTIGRTRESFLDNARARLRGLDCYRAGWEHADRRQAATGEQPALGSLIDRELESSPTDTSAEETQAPAGSSPPEADTFFDAGEMSCGDLALQLRKELTGLNPGTVLEVVALDLAAPEDLPAWCKLTGHTLLQMQPPHYWIQRRTDS